MSEQVVPNVGFTPPENSRRDAIHVAVIPVTASETLDPGEPVGLDSDGGFCWVDDEPIGVVDPFLKGAVMKGEQFWLFLFPNTVTHLRHAWSHPAFTAHQRFVQEWRDSIE